MADTFRVRSRRGLGRERRKVPHGLAWRAPKSSCSP